MEHRPFNRPDAANSPLNIALQRELRIGERVVWKGFQLSRVSRAGFGLYLFAIPWTAFALFWTVGAAGGIASLDSAGPGFIAWAFPLFGVPFVLIGFAMFAAPFMPLLNGGKPLFAVTNERGLRIFVGRSLDVQDVPAKNLGSVKRNERRDGTGSLKIAIGIRTDSDGDKQTDYFELGEVADVIGAHDAVAKLSGTA